MPYDPKDPSDYVLTASEKFEYDNNGNVIYREDSGGYWSKAEYDEAGNVIYYENSNGIIRDNRDRIQEGLMLGYKKFPDRYFDYYTILGISQKYFFLIPAKQS